MLSRPILVNDIKRNTGNSTKRIDILWLLEVDNHLKNATATRTSRNKE